MAFKPNFTSLERSGDMVRVVGTSDEIQDILEIRVLLAQEGRVERGTVGTVGAVWDVEIPSDGFVAGPAVAFGVETRRENLTTVTWAESVTIPEA